MRAFLGLLKRRWGWVVLVVLIVASPTAFAVLSCVFGGTRYLVRAIPDCYLGNGGRSVRLYLWLGRPVNAKEPARPQFSYAGGLWNGESGRLYDQQDQQPLTMAIRWHSSDLVTLLLHHGADPNLRSEGGYLPLQVAARRGEAAMAESLIQAGAKVNAVDDGACTALDVANRGNAELLIVLLDHDARLNVAQNGRELPLAFEASSAKEALDRCLLGAAAEASPEAVRLLLDRGADPNYEGPGGVTPLICLAASSKYRYETQAANFVKCAEILIGRGASPDLATRKALDSTEFAKVIGAGFVADGLPVRTTALHLCAKSHFMELAECLLKHGAKSNLVDADGMTPLDIVDRLEVNLR